MKSKILLLGLLTIVLSISLVMAVPIDPPDPHAFYGFANDLDGNVVSDGALVSAHLNGVIAGSTEVKDGKYGFGQDTLIALSYDSEGGVLDFYIDGVDTGISHSFQALQTTFLNLSANVSSSSVNVCGDGEVDDGEDCDGSFSEVCSDVLGSEYNSGTLRCSSECTWETSLCAIDNGSSDDSGNDNDSGSSSGSSGGGSGGGGGGSSSSSSTTDTENTDEVEFTPVSGSSNSNNDPSDVTERFEEQGSRGSGITGFSVGNLGTGGTVGIGILVILLILALVFFIFKKYKQN